jgi:hypothetical protein
MSSPAVRRLAHLTPESARPFPGAHGSGRLFSGTLIAERSQRSDSGSSSNRGMTCIWGCRYRPGSSRADSRLGPADRAAPSLPGAIDPECLPTPRGSARRPKSGGRWARLPRSRAGLRRPVRPGPGCPGPGSRRICSGGLDEDLGCPHPALITEHAAVAHGVPPHARARAGSRPHGRPAAGTPAMDWPSPCRARPVVRGRLGLG